MQAMNGRRRLTQEVSRLAGKGCIAAGVQQRCARQLLLKMNNLLSRPVELGNWRAPSFFL